MKEKTDTTRRLWQYLSERAMRGRPPASLREMCRGAGLSSTSHAKYQIKKLAASGYVTMEDYKTRAYKVVVPLIAIGEK